MAHEKPFAHNAMTDLLRRTQLDVGGLDRYAPSGRSISPVTTLRLLDSTSTPITSPNVTMRYVRENNLLHAWFQASNPQGGVAPWQMELPVQPSTLGVNNIPCGQWAGKASPNAMDGWVEVTLNGGTYYARFMARNTAGPAAPSIVGPLYPWNWAAAPGLPAWTLGGWLAYEVADAYTP